MSPAIPTRVVPELTAPRRPSKLTTDTRTLDNGLRVVTLRQPGIPLVELRLRIPFFSSASAHPAIASVLSDTILTGTERHDRAGLAVAIQSLGGDLHASVDADRLVLSGNVLASNLGAFLALVAETLATATYVKHEVDAEAQRLIEHLKIARSRAGIVAAEALAKQMWGDHPYARELPTITDVEAVTAAKVRSLSRSLVQPSGATLVLVGDVTAKRAMGAAEKAFAFWQGKAKKSKAVLLPHTQPGALRLVDRPGSVQSSIRLGRSALVRTDERYPALQLANLIFGGYFSSRWNENIREDKGYTYGSHSRLEHNQLGSTLVLDADVATEVTAAALLETTYELGKIASLPVTAAELDSARQYAIGTLALSTATQAGLASTLSGLLAQGLDAQWLTEHPERLKKVTVDQVHDVAAEYFAPSTFVPVVVGDADTIAAPLARLGAVTTSES
jgi:predicted Zn-dependent peptidase